MNKPAELPKRAKGSRPYFFDDPTVDKLLAMLLALTGEVSGMRDRQDTLERILGEKGTISIDEIERYEPTAAVLTERDDRREQYLKQILRTVDLDSADLDKNDLSPAWQRVIDFVNEPA